MDIVKYCEKAEEISETCEYNDSHVCINRFKYRDCDRPMCCGLCPTITECENKCNWLDREINGGNNSV